MSPKRIAINNSVCLLLFKGKDAKVQYSNAKRKADRTLVFNIVFPTAERETANVRSGFKDMGNSGSASMRYLFSHRRSSAACKGRKNIIGVPAKAWDFDGAVCGLRVNAVGGITDSIRFIS
jgi:hypothetical protein